MILLGYILKILLAISAQLNVFSDYVSKLVIQQATSGKKLGGN